MSDSFSVTVAAAELEPWPLDPEQILAGHPEVSGLVLYEDDHVERGIWQHTAGESSDTEADEMFVVLSGRATIVIEDGPTLEVAPGDVGIFAAGARTHWTVHETLRKTYQVTHAH